MAYDKKITTEFILSEDIAEGLAIDHAGKTKEEAKGKTLGISITNQKSGTKCRAALPGELVKVKLGATVAIASNPELTAGTGGKLESAVNGDWVCARALEDGDLNDMILAQVVGYPKQALTASAFVDAADTPANYSSASLKAVRVNVGETALEFVDLNTLYYNETEIDAKLLAIKNYQFQIKRTGTGDWASDYDPDAIIDSAAASTNDVDIVLDSAVIAFFLNSSSAGVGIPYWAYC
jgi:hypothetical protein